MLLANIKQKAEMKSLVFLRQEAANYLPGITAFWWLLHKWFVWTPN